MTDEIKEKIKLTQYSHGAGCGCKISPALLTEILKGNEAKSDYPNLLVGNHSRDDAAVLDLGNGTCLISTTDFFMPVVDDPFDFGRIAATNAISDVYAMGGKPVLAIAVFGWPIDKLPPEVASQVIAGGRSVCEEAGIPLAGGHSIDSPEPIFGLAVNGIVDRKYLKKNNTAQEGDLLFLTKKLGVGVLATASKKSLLKEEDLRVAVKSMTTLNSAGEALGKLSSIHSLTDVTGFGLLGHLVEMADGSNCSAEIEFSKVPVISSVRDYIAAGCIPGGTNRNWKSYGHQIGSLSDEMKLIMCDPQTSGGLLVSVDPRSVGEYLSLMKELGFEEYALTPIGRMTGRQEKAVTVY